MDSASTKTGILDCLSDRWLSLLLAAFALLLLARCWNADFLFYDDFDHIHLNPQFQGSIENTFRLTPALEYMPVTILSYRLDRFFFDDACSLLLGTWAPAARLMNWVYHVAAALVLWRLLMTLGLSRMTAWLLALVFAVHPTACETVCWISERKNALSALCGFASLLVFLRPRSSWRVPATTLLFLAANLSKPSALGLLPVLVLLDLFGGVEGLSGAAPTRWRPGRDWWPVFLRMLPLAVVSAAIVALNLSTHQHAIVQPPGGTIYTALLTDATILVRYLSHVFWPVGLSAVYYVEPVTSVWDVRLGGCLLTLAALISGTIWLAGNRRRALLGWLWFVLALTPQLNLIAIPYPMQDRYIYLSLPGLLLVIYETVNGMRVRSWIPAKPISFAVPAILAALLSLSAARSHVYANTYELFSDAARKQPQAAHAHYGLSLAYKQLHYGMSQSPAAQAADLDRIRGLQAEQSWAFLTCPDATRQIHFASMALDAGKYALSQGRLDEAERYFRMGAFPPATVFAAPTVRAAALMQLSETELLQKKNEDALSAAKAALALTPGQDDAIIVYARAALAVLKSQPGSDAHQLATDVCEQLKRVGRTSAVYGQALKLIKECSGY
ncbi:MAG TPA: hypothetical protein VGP72_32410 [Planctomycetota bacterium]